ncbi:hypothetical protein EDWATA_00475 [Edwardsiella tarda ATCC 23685]|uniref:Uncharacterized protein n=1 Tax=Edwardsiella tarda ATCC 23685 TaxID=500638 RepID=D4F191_EDWTA|nr:hypothetical protein EDWATA_00475 [Edwardsiella tarda ATCC 23685]
MQYGDEQQMHTAARAPSSLTCDAPRPLAEHHTFLSISYSA